MLEAPTRLQSEESAAGARTHGRRPIIYLSFAPADAELVGPVVAGLAERIDCELLTIDPQRLLLSNAAIATLRPTISAGDSWQDSLNVAIESADVVLALVAGHWTRSPSFAEEINVAAMSQKLIVATIGPFRADGAPDAVRRLQWARLDIQPQTEQIARLAADLSAFLANKAATQPIAAEVPDAASSPGRPEISISAMRKSFRAFRARNHESARVWFETATRNAVSRSARQRDAMRRWLRNVSRPRWRTLFGSFATLVAFGCFLSWLTFVDLAVGAREQGPIVRRDTVGDLALFTRGTGGAVLRKTDLVAPVGGHGEPIVTGLLAAGGYAITLDIGGTIRAIGWTSASALMSNEADRLAGVVRYDTWRVFWRPIARVATDWTARLVPIAPPAAIAGGRAYAFRDCAGCPEMVVLKPGWTFVGAPWERLSGASLQARRLVQIPSAMAVMLRPVTAGDYLDCVNAGACPARANRSPATLFEASAAAAYANWLSIRAGRRYRVPVRAELTYAVATMGADDAAGAAFLDCSAMASGEDTSACPAASGARSILLVADVG